MERFVRILSAIFWVAAPLFVAMVALSVINYALVEGLFGDRGLRLIFGVLVGVVLICSGTIVWYEFRSNPLEEDALGREYGAWTGTMLFYGIVFGITLFISAFFLPAAFFAYF